MNIQIRKWNGKINWYVCFHIWLFDTIKWQKQQKVSSHFCLQSKWMEAFAPLSVFLLRFRWKVFQQEYSFDVCSYSIVFNAFICGLLKLIKFIDSLKICASLILLSQHYDKNLAYKPCKLFLNMMDFAFVGTLSHHSVICQIATGWTLLTLTFAIVKHQNCVILALIFVV